MLQLIKMAGQNGKLVLTADQRHAEIHVCRGFIIRASSPEEILLGEYPSNEGLLRMEDLTRALEVQKRMGFPLGRILHELGFVPEDRGRWYRLLNRYLREVAIAPRMPEFTRRDVVNLLDSRCLQFYIRAAAFIPQFFI